MTEYDYRKIFPRMPGKVTIGDITVRDGFQHEEKFISTAAKNYYLEELIFAGCRNIAVTNLGNPPRCRSFAMRKSCWPICAATLSERGALPEG